MDGESPARRSRWQFGLGLFVAFGLLVMMSGFMVASISVTLQGIGVAVVGIVGLLLTAARLPHRVPSTAVAGAVVLVATAVENARSGLSAWAPLGLLVGVALLSVPIRALPPARKLDPAEPGAAVAPRTGPRTGGREPGGAVVLVAIGLVLMVGYEALAHVSAPDVGDLPSYLAAVGMPFAAAIGAGALALLAARRGGAAGLAAGGALVMVSAGLYMAQAAGNAWWTRRSFVADAFLAPGYRGNVAAVQVSSAYESSRSVSYSLDTEFAATTLVVVGLVLTVAGWWWAAVRRAAPPAPDHGRGHGPASAG